MRTRRDSQLSATPVLVLTRTAHRHTPPSGSSRPSRARCGPPDIGASMHATPFTLQARREALDVVRRDGRAQHAPSCPAARHQPTPAGAEQHVIASAPRRPRHTISSWAVGAPDRHSQKPVARPAWSSAGLRPRGAGRSTHTRPAPVEQPPRHRAAHVADADHADWRCKLRSLLYSGLGGNRGHQLCIKVRLRAMDIRMPGPMPNVTVAVPP